MKVLALIPARYESTRFPGKPLALINGRSMISIVYESVIRSGLIDKVIVLTDDERIMDHCNSNNINVMMTQSANSGTERIAHAITKISERYDIILNIQGDEPLINRNVINDLIETINSNKYLIGTLKKEIISIDDINNPNIAKVITNNLDEAIYFSRSTIPYVRKSSDHLRYYKHIGVYAYKPDFLRKYFDLTFSVLSEVEQLEQLQFIENGFKIIVKESKFECIGVDIPSDIDKVEEILRGKYNE